MNINLWLEKTLSNIRSSDPKVLIAKMEEYGLIEDDVDRDHPACVWSEMELVAGTEINGLDIYLNHFAPSRYSLFVDCAGQQFIHSEELTFTATPRNAAFSFNSSLPSVNLINSNPGNTHNTLGYEIIGSIVPNHFSGYDSSNLIVRAA